MDELTLISLCHCILELHHFNVQVGIKPRNTDFLLLEHFPFFMRSGAAYSFLQQTQNNTKEVTNYKNKTQVSQFNIR
jgi:hypothetical protein